MVKNNKQPGSPVQSPSNKTEEQDVSMSSSPPSPVWTKIKNRHSKHCLIISNIKFKNIDNNILVYEDIKQILPKATKAYVTPNEFLKIYFETESDANNSKVKAKEHFKNAKIVSTIEYKYEIAVLRVPKSTPSQILNKYLKNSIEGIINIKWANKNKKKYGTMIVAVESKKILFNTLKKKKNILAGQKFKIESKRKPNRLQCKKCLQFGHLDNTCKDDKLCKRCGSKHHEVAKCVEEKPKCFNCGLEHNAFSKNCYKRRRSSNNSSTE